MIPQHIKQNINNAITLIAKYETSHTNAPFHSNKHLSEIKSRIVTIDKLWDTITSTPNNQGFINTSISTPNEQNFINTINNFILLIDRAQQNNTSLDNNIGELSHIQTSLADFITYLIIDHNSIEFIINKASQSFGTKISDIEKQFNNKINEALELMPKVNEKLNMIDDEANKLIEKKIEINEQLQTQSFNLQNKILSAVFDKKCQQLIKERKFYLFPAIVISIILGCAYLIFFYLQFSDNKFCYINHIMLIGVCTPFIFLVIWLFYQVARVTRLSEIYAYKATLGFTIEDAISQINKYDNKDFCSNTIKELLLRLYETPINHQNEKSIIIRNISELTDLMKETRNIIESFKTSTNK